MISIYLLIKEKNIQARGLELVEENVKKCIYKGLSVIEGNAETELNQFPSQSFFSKIHGSLVCSSNSIYINNSS